MSDSQNQIIDASNLLKEVYALMETEQWEEVMATLNTLMVRDDVRSLVEQHPSLVAEMLSLLGVTVYRSGNLGEAISLFERVQNMPGSSSDVPEVLAVLYALAGRLTDALFYGKLATTRPCDNKVLDLLGIDFPKFADAFLNIHEKPLIRAGSRMLAAGKAALALSNFDQHLSLDERDVEALEGKACALLELERGNEAVKVLRYLRQLSPDNAAVVSLLASALTATANVHEAQACHQLAVSMAPDDIVIAASWLRDASVFPGEAELLYRKAHKALVRALECEDEDHPRPTPRKDAPIKVGYLVANLLPAQAEMVGAVLLQQKSILVLYGNGEQTDPHNKPFQGGKAVWRNVSGLDGYTFAEVVRGDEVSVLVNASGWRAPQYLQAHPQRPAPVQVSWMNGPSRDLFPGIDWRLAGVDGKGNWGLPHGAYVVNLDTLPILSVPVERAAILTFGVDTSIAHITPDVALCWARLLLEKPEARLVLRDQGLSYPETRQHLVDLFGDFGVAHRIEIADEVNMAVFMAGLDLFLVPFRDIQFGRVAAALMQGVPVIALDQSGRGMSPFLKAAGVDERMVASSEEDYVAKGVRLCEDSGYRRVLVEEASAFRTCPIFDMQGLANVLDETFKRMVADVSV